MADQKPKRKVSPEEALRLFAYAMFCGSSLLLMVALSIPGWNWRPALVGTLVFGALTLVMYRLEEARKDRRAEQRQAQRNRGGSFDFSDDDDEDPTQPPTRIR